MGGILLAAARWAGEPAFYRDRIFRGRVGDFGGTGDPFARSIERWPHVTEVVTVDQSPGPEPWIQADLETWTPEPNSFNTIVSSHSLEHLTGPYGAVAGWVEALRPGGYLLVIVPAWETYERRRWPPVVNTDHRTAWTMDRWSGHEADTVPLHSLMTLAAFTGLRLIRATTLDEGFDPTTTADQTANGTCECGYELVLQRP